MIQVGFDTSHSCAIARNHVEKQRHSMQQKVERGIENLLHEFSENKLVDERSCYEDELAKEEQV